MISNIGMLVLGIMIGGGLGIAIAAICLSARELRKGELERGNVRSPMVRNVGCKHGWVAH